MSTSGERHLWVWYSPYGLGGVETYLLSMARESVRDGVAVWVAATKTPDGPLCHRFVEAGAQLLDWSEFHAAYMGETDSGAIRQRLIADIGRIRPTLVALNDCNDFSIGVAPLMRRLRPYCTVIDTLHIDSPVDQYLEFRRTFVDVLDGIAGTNQSIVDRFRGRSPGAAAVEARYIANGVAVPARDRKPADGTLRLLYVGRLAQDQKRVMELPPLLNRLRARGTTFRMTIVGDGPSREMLAVELARLNLGEWVRITGYLSPDAVEPLYFEHDVLVNLSAFEGFSMSVLEALAAGCVPVCTEVASLDRSVFKDGVNCRLCPVERLDTMVDILSTLSPEVLHRMSAAARATGHEMTPGKTYREYRNLIADVRVRRPLRPWPSDATTAVQLDWDLTRDNPWLARPHPLRRLAGSAWAQVRKTLSDR